MRGVRKQEKPQRGEIFIENKIYNTVEPQRGDTQYAVYVTPAELIYKILSLVVIVSPLWFFDYG